MTLDVLIIGGGPAGATTALLLAEAGWSVGIVEKKTFPRRKVCGEFISATSLPLLQKIGMADFYFEHGGPEVKRVGLYAGATILTAKMPPAISSAAKWGRSLSREHLDKTLLDRAIAAGAKCWQPANAKSLEQKAGLFNCTISMDNQTEVIDARLVVMANGSWEKGFDHSIIKTHKPYDLLAFKAHFKNSVLPSDLMPLLAFPGGYGGLAHCDNQRVTLSCCIRRDTLQHARKKQPELQAGETVLRYIMSVCRGARDVLEHAERDGNWLAAGPIQPGIRSCYKQGIFFVGNIAGEAHPVVAEGISMAMQSAWLLSQTLIARQKEIMAGKGANEAGAEYAKLWHQHFASRIHAAALFARLAMMPSWAVSLIGPVLKQFPSILTLSAKLSGKAKQVVPLNN